MVIGLKIKCLRESNNMTQFDLAQKTGFKQSQISKLERGNRNLIDREIPLFAQVLGVTINELLGENEQTESKEVG